MYIRDMRNTKGHVSGLTSGLWHPTDRFTAMTGSEDGTVRCAPPPRRAVRARLFRRCRRLRARTVLGLAGLHLLGPASPARNTLLLTPHPPTPHPTPHLTPHPPSIWDTWNIAQKTVIKPTLSAPGRVAVTSVAYNSDGRYIAAGLMDGTIQVGGGAFV
jgi:WD40 repeat protein